MRLLGVLGCYWRAVAEGRALGQACWCLRLHWRSRWWTGVDCASFALDSGPPWCHICSPWLRQGFRPINEPQRGSWWYVLCVVWAGFKITYLFAGSPWGAGTFAGADGSRQPSALELEIAEIQGKNFYETVAKAHK